MNWFFVIVWLKFKILDVILGISLECMQIKYFKITTIIIIIQARSWPKICQDLCFWRLVPFHSAPETFENGRALRSTLVRHERLTNKGFRRHLHKRAFRKHSWNRRDLKTPALCFTVKGKHFENRAFRKRWSHVISLAELSTIINPK